MSIKKGDLVMVVKSLHSCAAPSTAMGKIFTVTRISHLAATYCNGCYTPLGPQDVAHGLPSGEQPLWRLKRIHPLYELEREQEKKEFTA